MHFSYDVSLILACYNEAEIFEESVAEIFQVLDKTDWTYEVIFIDDKSRDDTQVLIKKIISKYHEKHTQIVLHTKNIGRGGTIMEGIRKSQGKVVGFIDIDLEVSAWYLPRFIETVMKDYDLAIGNRVYDFNYKSIGRWIASKGYCWIRNIFLRMPLKDTEAGYKFFRKSAAVKLIKLCKDKHWFWDTEIVYYASVMNYRIASIPVAFVKRNDKTSTVKIISDTFAYMKALFNFRKLQSNYKK